MAMGRLWIVAAVLEARTEYSDTLTWGDPGQGTGRGVGEVAVGWAYLLALHGLPA